MQHHHHHHHHQTKSQSKFICVFSFFIPKLPYVFSFCLSFPMHPFIMLMMSYCSCSSHFSFSITFCVTLDVLHFSFALLTIFYDCKVWIMMSIICWFQFVHFMDISYKTNQMKKCNTELIAKPDGRVQRQINCFHFTRNNFFLWHLIWNDVPEAMQWWVQKAELCSAWMPYSLSFLFFLSSFFVHSFVRSCWVNNEFVIT